MKAGHRQRIEAACGRRLAAVEYLPGGCVGEVWKVTLEGGEQAVAKTAAGADSLDIEAYMLGYLVSHSDLPVPAVLSAAPDLLLMEYVTSSAGIDARAEEHAADLLAALHDVTAPGFGHERDTLIGPLPQPNPWCDSWISFFRDHRLLYMGRLAHQAGRLEDGVLARLERLCGVLDGLLEEPAAPSLVHGDVWGGNVLPGGDGIAAFIDPAIYHAHAEVELAYTTLFNTFGPRFFDRYREHRPIEAGFFEDRLPIYHLHPLLVHAALFGGGYGRQVDEILKRYC